MLYVWMLWTWMLWIWMLWIWMLWIWIWVWVWSSQFFFTFQCQRCKSLFPTVEASEHHASLCYKNAPLIKLHLRDIDSLIHQQNNQEKVLPKAAFIISREISGCTVRTVSEGPDRIKPIRAAPNSGLVTQERLTYQHCGICSKAVSGKIKKIYFFH